MTGRWPNLVLTGFMGTGKTTVGRALATKLCYEYVDTDQVIASRYGPIPEIFANQGEATFRSYERDLAIELAERDGCVIATGGHMLLDPANASVLTQSGYVFCLVASVDTIVTRVTRIADPTRRPLLDVDDPAGRVAALLRERAEGYAQFVQVDTDGRTPGEIAETIIAHLAPGPSVCS